MRKVALSLLAFVAVADLAAAQSRLPGTAPLTAGGDLAIEMVDGINAWLLRETAAAREKRAGMWKRDFESPAAYEVRGR